ncbi:TonB-dependent siderophore receptor [Sphingosinicella sp. CPCC 101087]|uniref:TonB-dependent receptor plug domain-containing protein n=1 Tax=Sphingosinicella sp. CPCC 101087 TaxID=2497754 RepID=UPI00101D0E6E|nr:TonB-dependent receptor [Sphingosinicella sp. CPCC 101087]
MISLKAATLLVTTSLLASAAYAQEAEPPAAAAESEAIIITGSRLPSTDLTAAAPVTVLDREEIDQTGAQSVGELLRELPVASPSASESAGRGNNGSANVALRGLSAVNTLVLIDGRRVIASTAGGTVDLNSIPFEAIERVEVLQDGASAVYGSDAIAGVVNIIMRRSYDGLLLRGGYGISSRGDLPNRELSATFGQEFDRGGFVLSASWRKADGNRIAQRPVSRDPDWRSRGGRNFRDPLPIYTSFRGLDPGNPDRELIIREGVTQATSLSDFRDFLFPGTNDPGANDGINYWQYESSASDIEQVNLWFNGNYELTEGIRFFLQGGFNSRESLGYLAPDYIGEVFGDTVIVSANNDFNPFGVDVSAARSFVEQPRDSWRQSDVDSKTYRFIAGLEGEFGGGWHWDVSYNQQHLDQLTYSGRGINLNRIREAAGDSDVCRALNNGCVPINLFGAPGSISQEVFDFISTDLFSDVSAELRSAVANVRGTLFSLPAGDVGLALGAEYREEEFSQNNNANGPDDVFAARGTIGPDFFPPIRKISEVYAETAIPILRDLPLIESLDVEAAVRFSDYNDFGSTTNPKVGIRWRPYEDLMLRGSWGTGFRAPSFTETYSGTSRGFRPIVDPCTGEDFASFPGCNGRRAITDSSGAWVISGGNPDLQPEDAENLTIGLVFTPSFIPRLAITVDYYRIKKDNIIGTADVNYMILQNALDGTSYADRITRNENNYVFEVTATRDNLLNQSIRGIDIGASYETPTASWGKLSLRTDVTYLDSYKNSPAPDVAPIERSGTYTTELGTLAKWRATGRATWSYGDFDLSYAFRYVDGVLNQGSLRINGEQLRARSYFQSDLVANFYVNPGDMKLTLGVENVFDRMPPWLEGNYQNGFDQGVFNSRGRYFFARVEKKF